MLAAAEEVDGVIAPGIDWPVAIAARIAARFDPPCPFSPNGGARGSRSSGSASGWGKTVPQPAWRMVADASVSPCPASSSRRIARSKGLTLVTDEAELPAAVATAISGVRSGAALVEARPGARGDRQRVLDRRAFPPAHGDRPA